MQEEDRFSSRRFGNKIKQKNLYLNLRFLKLALLLDHFRSCPLFFRDTNYRGNHQERPSLQLRPAVPPTNPRDPPGIFHHRPGGRAGISCGDLLFCFGVALLANRLGKRIFGIFGGRGAAVLPSPLESLLELYAGLARDELVGGHPDGGGAQNLLGPAPSQRSLLEIQVPWLGLGLVECLFQNENVNVLFCDWSVDRESRIREG